MAKIIYIAIGNEILLGKTINTNETFIGEHLSAVGLPLDSSVAIKDDITSIQHTLRHCWDNNDVVIVTGGLGPTHDDITKYVLSKFFKKKLVFDSKLWENLTNRYEKRETPIPKNVKTQAEIPQGFTTLQNSLGTAPGLYYSEDNKHFFAMPGVPSEMKFILENSVLPILLKQFSVQPIIQRTIHTINIPESVLFDSVYNIHETPNTKIAFLPKPGMVDIRVYGTSKNEMNEIMGRLMELIPQKNIYGFDNDTIVSIFHKKMIASEKTVSAAESCTGGLIQSMITDNPGSSEYFLGGVVSYSNEAKMKLLGVKDSTLQKHGAVSKETVAEMVSGVKKLIGTDYAIAVSGIAGPDGGTDEKPVGLVYIGTLGKSGLIITKNVFSGTRIDIKNKTTFTALHQLKV